MVQNVITKRRFGASHPMCVNDYDPDQDGITSASGDMLKSVYDPNEDGMIGTAQIEDIAITNPKIADDSIDSRTIIRDGVRHINIAGRSISGPKVAFGAILRERIVSDTLRHSNDLLKETNSATYVKMKVIRFDAAIKGGFRVRWSLASGLDGTHVITKLMRNIHGVNRVALGVSRSTTSTIATIMSHDFTNIDWNVNDELEIWGRTLSTAVMCRVSNFRIFYDNLEPEVIPKTNTLV